MEFAVESWDPAYGTSTDQAGLDQASEPVDAAVEVPLDRWKPIDPDGSQQAETMLFIDGVRRIDTRVWITDGPLARPGLCATVAAGAVLCSEGSASVVAAQVERGLYTAVENAEPIVTPNCGTYELRAAAGDEDADLYLSVHKHMTAIETSLSEGLVADGLLAGAGAGAGAAAGAGRRVELVVFDGPLRGRDASAGVGYVKTQHVQYLDENQHTVVAELNPGQRTPVFAIGSGGRFPRWSWYLRLPGPRSHPLSGIVRLELPGLGGPEAAAERADVVSATLPRFASEPHKEARAPQNLYPISGLEKQLRRRLGHPHLLEKALRVASSSAGVVGASSG